MMILRASATLSSNTLKAFAPIRRLAVLYTPGEKNSELQLRELQGLQAAMGIKVVPVILVSKEDVARIVPDVARTAEAIYLTGSSVVGERRWGKRSVKPASTGSSANHLR